MEAQSVKDPWPDDTAAASREVVRHVLVVDDSRVQRKILSALLRKWGYDVVEAGSAEAALDHCRTANPDLILSDWMMPGMTGLDFCAAYRALDHESYGYFILLTSRNEKHDVALGLERGADDFLTKPVNAAELRARLSAGERILAMQRVVTDRNRALADALAELRSIYRALDRDLDEARRLQQSLVPERFRVLQGAEVSLLLRPSGHVGGDLVGLFRVSDTRVGLYGLDVAGHGIASALMTARVAGHLTGSSPEQNVALTVDDAGHCSMRPPDEVCGVLNRLIAEDMETEHYLTMLLADCDLRSGRVRMAQAGHPSPLLLRADGGVEFVGTGGMPVGLLQNARFSTFDVRLNPGDRLLIYSDGITECPDPEGRLLDDDGLKDSVRRNARLRGPDLLEALVWDLSQHARGRDFPDDVSAVLLERGSAPVADEG